MAVYNIHTRKKINTWKKRNVLLYANPLTNLKFFIHNEDLSKVNSEINSEINVKAGQQYHGNYIESKESISDNKLSLVKEILHNVKSSNGNVVLRNSQDGIENVGHCMECGWRKVITMVQNNTNSFIFHLVHDQYDTPDFYIGTEDAVQNIAHNRIYLVKELTGVYFINTHILGDYLKIFIYDTLNSKINHINISEESEHSKICTFQNSVSNLNLWGHTIIEEKIGYELLGQFKTSYADNRVRHINDMESNNLLAPYMRCWHVVNLSQGYKIRNLLATYNIITLNFMKNNYFVIAYGAKIKIAVQLENITLIMCRNQTIIGAKLNITNTEHNPLIINSSLLYPKLQDILKTHEKSYNVKKLKSISFSSEITNHTNDSSLSNQVKTPTNNVINDKKAASQTCSMESVHSLDLKTHQIISIDHLLVQHYNIMKKLNMSDDTKNKNENKLHCNSTILMGKMWLRNLMKNSKYITIYLNIPSIKYNIINETMFETPLLNSCVEVVDKYSNFIISQAKYILKPLGINFFFVILSYTL